MRPFSVAVAVLLTCSISFQAQSQSTAIPFLLISSSTHANGMGEADVADHTDDPFSPIANPAHLGMLSRTNYLTSGYDHSDWLPGFGLPDLKYSVYAVNAGFNLQQFNENAPALLFGVGYSNIHLNLGRFVVISEDTPAPIGEFDAWENADQYSFGIGYEYGIRMSAGVTVKYVHSQLSPLGPGLGTMDGSAKITLYDYGVLLDMPLVDIASRLSRTSFALESDLSPYVDCSLGFANNNLGQETISYGGMEQKDPLPRYARAGIGVDMGLALKKDNFTWKPLSFKWTTESADPLVDYDRATGRFTGYQRGLGDIKFIDEVISGRTNIETEKKKGWEASFMEIVSVRGGRFEEDYTRGNRRLNTSGWGIRFAGFAKLLRAVSMPNTTGGLVRFMIEHVDVRYDHSEWSPDDNASPLGGTKFDSIGLSISN